MAEKYQIRDGTGWETCKKATTSGCKPGWLHYELQDGTIGMAYNRPNSEAVSWRLKPHGKSKETIEEQ